MRDQDTSYNLRDTRKLTLKQKLAHYRTPDYCIVTRAETLQILKLELDPLCEDEGFFY